MIETTLNEKQKQALKQEEQIIRLLKEYKRNIAKISAQIQGDQHRLGTVGLFKTETPSLIVESRIHQKEIESLISEIQTTNFNIAEAIRRF